MRLQLVTMIQNYTPKNIENWQLVFATCISQQPEHAEIEIIQGTLKEDILQVCITIHSCSLQTPPLLGIRWPFILQSKNPQQEKMEEKAQEQARMLYLWAALTTSMVPWTYSYPWIYVGITWRK